MTHAKLVGLSVPVPVVCSTVVRSIFANNRVNVATVASNELSVLLKPRIELIFHDLNSSIEATGTIEI